MLPVRFRELGPPIAEQWTAYRRRPGKWYKLLVMDPHSGRLRMFICSSGKSLLTAVLVTTNNQAKCAIETRPGCTTLRLKLDTDGEVLTAKLAPATKLDIETYTQCWSNLKALFN